MGLICSTRPLRQPSRQPKSARGTTAPSTCSLVAAQSDQCRNATSTETRPGAWGIAAGRGRKGRDPRVARYWADGHAVRVRRDRGRSRPEARPRARSGRGRRPPAGGAHAAGNARRLRRADPPFGRRLGAAHSDRAGAPPFDGPVRAARHRQDDARADGGRAFPSGVRGAERRAGGPRRGARGARARGPPPRHGRWGGRDPNSLLPRRDPPLQQGPAGRPAAGGRGWPGHADRRDDREPRVRGQRGAALAHARVFVLCPEQC